MMGGGEMFSVMPDGDTATKVMYISLFVAGAWLTGLGSSVRLQTSVCKMINAEKGLEKGGNY